MRQRCPAFHFLARLLLVAVAAWDVAFAQLIPIAPPVPLPAAPLPCCAVDPAGCAMPVAPAKNHAGTACPFCFACMAPPHLAVLAAEAAPILVDSFTPSPIPRSEKGPSRREPPPVPPPRLAEFRDLAFIQKLKPNYPS